VVVADVFIQRLIRRKNKKYNRIEDEMNSKLDWPPLYQNSGLPDGSSHPPADAAATVVKTDVIITDHDVSDPTEAFDSLFATSPLPPPPSSSAFDSVLDQTLRAGGGGHHFSASSHSTAAVFLNPPPQSPRKPSSLRGSRELPLLRSSESTPGKKISFSSAVSSPGGGGGNFQRQGADTSSASSRFVSCDSVHVENELGTTTGGSSLALVSDSSSDGAER
jgi:hypothetical protein